MRAILIHNPAAGTGSHTAEQLIAILKQAGYSDVTYCPKKERTYKKALRSFVDLVLIAGGDGTIAKIIRSMPRNDVTVAILPLGTANNIARSVGLPSDPDSLLDSLRGHRTRSFDLGTVSGPWGARRFVEGVGLGALAELMKPGPKPPAAERTKIGREMLKEAVSDARPQQLIITADGEELKMEVLMLEILNTRYIGPGLPVGPRSQPGDGLLDIVYLPPEARAEMLTWIDNPQHSAPFLVRQARKVNIRWEEHSLHVDDRAYPHNGVLAEVKIRSIRNGIKFCVPLQPSHQTL